MEVIKEYRLPYMPFQLLLVEGDATYGGDYSVDNPRETIPMTVAWSSFSEMNNIMYARNMVSKGYSEKDYDYYYYCRKKKILELEDGSPIYVICDYDEIHLCKENEEPSGLAMARGRKYNIKLVGYAKELNMGEIIRMLTDADDRGWKIYKCEEKVEYNYNGEYYVLDTENRLALNPKHFRGIKNKTQDINLYEKVIERLNEVSFILPQEVGNVEHDFCNEQVYGNFTFLMVHGFMRMN